MTPRSGGCRRWYRSTSWSDRRGSSTIDSSVTSARSSSTTSTRGRTPRWSTSSSISGSASGSPPTRFAEARNRGYQLGNARRPPLAPDTAVVTGAGRGDEGHVPLRGVHPRLPPHRAERNHAGTAPGGDPLSRLPDRSDRRPPLRRNVSPAHRPHRPRPRVRRDDVQLPWHGHERGRLLTAGMGRRPAHGDRLRRRRDVTVRRRARSARTRAGRSRSASLPTIPACAAPPCSARGPTSTTGPTIPGGSSNTPATSVRSRRRVSHRRSRNGAGRSGASARSSAPGGSLHGRCS